MQAESHPPASRFRAEAEVAISDPRRIIGHVFDHFAEHDADVTHSDDGAEATFFNGKVSMQARKDRLVMRADARDLGALAYLKNMLASHLVEFAEGERLHFSWTGDGVGLTAFPNLHEMTVQRVVDVTPYMRRITLSGPGVERYVSGGQHCKLFIPPEGLAKPEWPAPGEDGITVWPPEEKRPKVRTYTVRSVEVNAGTLDVDFVVHGEGSVGSRWAMRAKPGDIVGVRGPVGRPVPEADWYLLVGDETALPVIARTLEALPGTARGVAIIEVADKTEEQHVDYSADIELRWLHRSGADAGTTPLLVEAVHAVEMPPAGTRIHAMAGVEYSAFKEIRQYWREELQLEKVTTLAVAYWRSGKAEGEAER